MNKIAFFPHIRGIFFCIIIFFLLVLTLPFAWFFALFTKPLWIVRLWFRFIVYLLKIRIHVEGDIPKTKGVLFVSNHTSWIDIAVLGTLIPGFFVAKSEVAKWPLIGWISAASGIISIKRGNRQDTQTAIQIIKRYLNNKDSVIVFPEGTSSDGTSVLPFHSSLFSVLEETAMENGFPVATIPISVVFTHLWGLPLSLAQRPKIAWYGNMNFFPHLVGALCLGPIDVRVVFHPPLPLEGSRKLWSKQAEEIVTKGVYEVLHSKQPLL